MVPLLALLNVVSPLRAAELPASPDGFIVETKAGETIEILAARHLGDEKAAWELQRFNRRDPVKDAILSPGTLLAIPGTIRQEARIEVTDAAAMGEQALNAAAPSLSPTLFEKGMECLTRAQTGLEAAAYDRARASARLAQIHFETSIQEADSRAIKPLRAHLVRRGGEVELLDRDGQTLVFPTGGDFLDGTALKTSTNGVAEIALGEQAGLFVEPGSLVRLHRLQIDSRTRRVSGQLQMVAGEAYLGCRGGVTSLDVAGPEGSVTMPVTGGMVRVTVSGRDLWSVAAWEQPASLLSDSGKIPVPPGGGAVIRRDAVTPCAGLPVAPVPPEGAAARTSPISRPDFAPPGQAPQGALLQIELARDEAFLDRIERLPPGVARASAAFPKSRVMVRARWVPAPDAAGVAGPWSPVWPMEILPALSLTLEAAPPVFQQGPDSLAGPATKIAIQTAPTSAVVRVEASWNGGPFAACGRTLPLPEGVSGEVVLKVRGVSEPGETGPEVVWRARVDRDPPVVRTRLETAFAPAGPPENRLEIDATDPAGVARIEYQDASGSWLPYLRPIELKPGVSPVGIRAADRLGNQTSGLSVPLPVR